MRTEPTTSSYALLGLLAIRPWTAYDLTRQAQRSMRLFWPRSEAHIYGEVKRLVRWEYATGTTERTGNRERTSYAITPAGRRALRNWLATPPAAPQLEIEGLLRLLFADQGEKADAVQAIRATRAAVAETYANGAAQMRAYLDGGGPFPERAHLVGLLARFYADFAETMLDWCDVAEAEIEGWPDVRDAGLTGDSRRALTAMVERYERRAAALSEHTAE
ncbi:PadR family transcriptional regulator [Cryptosporangium aurantiacum]|uniref:Transcriptional regulator, PadR family n=1 Tax=Cryptosporangium aurantiacum TaxID=134849 RepID=A0A1M7MT19_9ACTN|nr:PadR family transcriptional regulator [Cryptosporangium aurantiacum]SHM94244.1 transcriptional regulator, PadR family [Cryptosporangium aurantiacum]